MLFIGEDEVKSGLYAVKDMVASAEYKLNTTDIIGLIQGSLDSE